MFRPDGLIPLRLSFGLMLAIGLAAAGGDRCQADPCGMVPPVTIPQDGGDVPLVRIGAQKTYVFYRRGIETIVLRPGYEGNVEDFGMLIPFPTPPAIRKVPDEIFEHIAAAIDPPEVVIDLNPPVPSAAPGGFGGGFGGGAFGGGGLTIRKDEVRVLREEAVGMYEVAVLEAGSTAALKRWMKDHSYRFPDGMEAACDDYVDQRWCFVAVKTKVARKKDVDPKPGMRAAKAGLPAGSSFEGHVQAMGFRFRSRKLEVPMRLSAFNAGQLRNIVYLLAEHGARIPVLDFRFVVRQIDGRELVDNLTQPLPVRVLGAEVRNGRITNLDRKTLAQYREQRDPKPHNALAAELFASDNSAAIAQQLAHSHEEDEKMLHQINERLMLRGDEIDESTRKVLAESREELIRDSLRGISSMTMTVIDGEFPRDVIARDNLTFSRFQMAGSRNNPQRYDARRAGPAEKKSGILLKTAKLDVLPNGPHGRPGLVPAAVSEREQVRVPQTTVAAAEPSDGQSSRSWPAVLAASGLACGLVIGWRRRGRPQR